MENQVTTLTTGDTAVVPRGTPFSYWSEVGFTRIYTNAAVPPGVQVRNETFGVVHDLLTESIPWDYAVFPDHY